MSFRLYVSFRLYMILRLSMSFRICVSFRFHKSFRLLLVRPCAFGRSVCLWSFPCLDFITCAFGFPSSDMLAFGLFVCFWSTLCSDFVTCVFGCPVFGFGYVGSWPFICFWYFPVFGFCYVCFWLPCVRILLRVHWLPVFGFCYVCRLPLRVPFVSLHQYTGDLALDSPWCVVAS